MENHKLSKRHCCVPECNSIQGEKNSLHRFPSRDKTLYEKWIKALNIFKPSKEMYVCSRHFGENDFFGGWLAVEPNKRRLKRGVIPNLELPKLEDGSNPKYENDQTNSLKNPDDFVTYLNLRPVKIISDPSDDDPNKDRSTKIREDENLQTEDCSNKKKIENLEPSNTDNLLILKRVAEIREAPESRAKKKHEAQVFMRKMKEFKRELNKQNSSSTTKIKVRKIQELTQPAVEHRKISHPGGSKYQVKKIRLISHSEAERMRTKMQLHDGSIQLLSKSELSNTDLKGIDMRLSQPRAIPELVQLSVKEIDNFSSPQHSPELSHLKKPEKHIQQPKNNENLPMKKITHSQHNRSTLFSAEALESNKIESDRFKKFENLVNNTIHYFDSVINDFDIEMSSKCQDTQKTELNLLNKNQSRGTAIEINRQVVSDAVPPIKVPLAESVNYLEKMVFHLSNELSLNGCTASPESAGQSTQTEDKSVQTDDTPDHLPKIELNIQNENDTLKKEITVLKSKIALLEKQLLVDRKTQLLYVIKS